VIWEAFKPESEPRRTIRRDEITRRIVVKKKPAPEKKAAAARPVVQQQDDEPQDVEVETETSVDTENGIY
jgi:hypothetical protein